MTSRIKAYWKEYRHRCGRLLFRGKLYPHTVIEIKCPRCAVIVRITDGEQEIASLKDGDIDKKPE